MGREAISCMRLLATSRPPPFILKSRHNISPHLDKQLVLELYIGVESLDVLEWLPHHIIFQKTLPLDQQTPQAAGHAGPALALAATERPRPVAAR